MDEQELITAAVEGSPHAGTFLVSVFGPQLQGYCRSISADLSDVDREMICEQAVELAVRKIDSFDRQKGTFPGWLRGFVRYTVLNWRRSAGLRSATPVDDLVLECPPSPPMPSARTSEMAQSVALAVRALAPEDQVYINLRYVQGLPTKEIAQRLDKSDAAVRQRLSRLQRSLNGRLSH